jgi:hypothetical protein
MEALLGLAVMFGGPALYVWLQWRAIRVARSPLGWFAAIVPVLFMAAATTWTGVGLSRNQNLAPLIVIFSFPIAIVWLGIAEAGRKVRRG